MKKDRVGKKFFGGYLDTHECAWLDTAAEQAGIDNRTALLKWFAQNARDIVPNEGEFEHQNEEVEALHPVDQELIKWLEGEIKGSDKFAGAMREIAKRMGWDPGKRAPK